MDKRNIFPDGAVEALARDVSAEVAELGGVFGEGESAAVDGGGHELVGWWGLLAMDPI